jgi:predicted nucleic acid-binding protein
MVFDTSVFVEMASGSKLGGMAYDILVKEGLYAITTELNIAELKYILCRRVSWRSSLEKVNKLLQSGYVEVLPVSLFEDHAALLKCNRAISIIDCFTISAGEVLGVRTLFAKHEEELDRELRKKPFGTEILFLEDWIDNYSSRD